MEIKKQVQQTLGDCWNGTAVNGTPYTQWKSTEEFFELWKQKKDEIKAVKYSLYKHDTMGWIVTLFGVHEGKYENYNEYKQAEDQLRFKRYYSSVMAWVEEGRGLSAKEKAEMIEEVEDMNTVDELYDFVQREAENPTAVWCEM